MSKIDIEKHALRDIEDLTCESVIRLGVEQASLFYELFRQFDLLADHPAFAQPVSGNHPDVLHFGFGFHTILFTVENDRIVVRRVLQSGMDVLRYL